MKEISNLLTIVSDIVSTYKSVHKPVKPVLITFFQLRVGMDLDLLSNMFSLRTYIHGIINQIPLRG